MSERFGDKEHVRELRRMQAMTDTHRDVAERLELSERRRLARRLRSQRPSLKDCWSGCECVHCDLDRVANLLSESEGREAPTDADAALELVRYLDGYWRTDDAEPCPECGAVLYNEMNSSEGCDLCKRGLWPIDLERGPAESEPTTELRERLLKDAAYLREQVRRAEEATMGEGFRKQPMELGIARRLEKAAALLSRQDGEPEVPHVHRRVGQVVAVNMRDGEATVRLEATVGEPQKLLHETLWTAAPRPIGEMHVPLRGTYPPDGAPPAPEAQVGEAVEPYVCPNCDHGMDEWAAWKVRQIGAEPEGKEDSWATSVAFELTQDPALLRLETRATPCPTCGDYRVIEDEHGLSCGNPGCGAPRYAVPYHGGPPMTMGESGPCRCGGAAVTGTPPAGLEASCPRCGGYVDRRPVGDGVGDDTAAIAAGGKVPPNVGESGEAEGEEGEEDDRPVPEAGQVWRHYAGRLCEVVTRAIIDATMEPAVVYRIMDEPHQTFVRRLDNWLEDVETKRWPSHSVYEPRFQLESSPESDAEEGGETVARKEAILAKLNDPRIKAVLDELVADRRSLNKALSDEPDSGLIGYIERAERIITALEVANRAAEDPSEEGLTQDESLAIADIIWWIKGRLDAGEYRPFGEDHVEALRKARLSARGADPESFRAE